MALMAKINKIKDLKEKSIENSEKNRVALLMKKQEQVLETRKFKEVRFYSIYS